MDTTEKLAHFIVETGYEAIPSAVVHAAKRVMIDTVGPAVGRQPTCPGHRSGL
jgi:2-methylcitrate dehydratase PrpD